MISQQTQEAVLTKLEFLYGPEQGGQAHTRLIHRLDRFRARHTSHLSPRVEPLTERDIVLITYGDLLQRSGEPPLATLGAFLARHLREAVNTVHVLPFFPYSSDDGFSVIDYRAVNPGLGTWDDIRRLKLCFRLMVDVVVNHVSAQSAWFESFLQGDQTYRDYFITVDPSTDLSMVVRPRALPLLTPVQTPSGERHVWTTFSADQIDLNYGSPDVLLEMVDVILWYIEHGADIIRLDAIAYLWKEIGTTCVHLPQTHAVVQLFRLILEEVAPGVLLITETNVPHEENISYLGDGTNEAHLVYQFPLPPLAAHAVLIGNARYLSEWADGLSTPSSKTAFFNFTASHDGIGIRPAAGILPDADVEMLVTRTRANGGAVSVKANPDGSTSPYELNITYFDLLNPPETDAPLTLQVRRFLVSQAILLALAGVPGIYAHSLLGSRNDVAAVEHTGHPRAINREKLSVDSVEADLADKTSLRHAVFYGYRSLIQKRIGERAFHPNGGQTVLPLNDSVFGMLRVAPGGDEAVIALHNLSAAEQTVILDLQSLGLRQAETLNDIITSRSYAVGPFNSLTLVMEPYQVAWLKPLQPPG